MFYVILVIDKTPSKQGLVAQLEERRLREAEAPGSNPGESISLKNFTETFYIL